ncbi:PTS mannitol transporter subunit IICB [Mesomycoplasma flocculare]|uniref:PTS system mannitol-specific EIICB component n=2 Tax=Mesomycoplasma flocculare TaxID=2128 RepID=A0AAW9XA49_MESFC|nr:PTS mannitol transporter subunit IICB [Mesomycoplasma flocculare]MXR12317.1 PTS mannose transporter subunit IIB [Mesomycoplasma flocculare]MXR22940.1 PTS mannose transporter subunit IIB [Mesomycoplasma flocculare]MXR56731.1 PTS mannose transporter subunit IIB [Mesomycoplasma flocculare]
MANLVKTLKTKIQAFGSLLGQMIMPLIGVFIAWGLLTSFFIPTGWAPNQELATMVGFGIVYVIPILICFLGGYKIYKLRGGAIAGIIAIAAVASGQSEIFIKITGGTAPMLVSVMLFGPISALILKHSEKFWIQKIPSGYQMLINNFYLGLLGFVLLFPVYYLSIYLVGYFIKSLGFLTAKMGEYKLYPLIALIIEPAKILFLNNAINHGVFTTLGALQVNETGKSILFLLESNPGPGLGILLFYLIFSKQETTKAQATSSIPIHFFGGIHEVYFPFALLKPILILALIAGGIFGNTIFQIFNVGALAPVSPGSIIAQYIQVEKSTNSLIGLTIAIFGSTIVSLISALSINFLLRLLNKNVEKKKLLVEKDKKINKNKKVYNENTNKTEISWEKIVFACDAGMGSSVMAASILGKILKENNILNVEISNLAIFDLTGKEEIIITIQSLKDRVRAKNQTAKIIVLTQFLDKKSYENIALEIKKTREKEGKL